MSQELEIINPSDEVYISDADIEATCAAVLFLGQGKYGLKTKVGERVMPVFLFGGAQEWWRERFGEEFEAFVEKSKPRIAEALSTVRYARERTSMNDIGKYAETLCKHFSKNETVRS